jgi:hypothetical protein
VTLDGGAAKWSWPTPYGPVTNLTFLDEAQSLVLFVNRHFCTNVGVDGEAVYAPPHDLNFHALLWALKELQVQAIVALGSTGTLRPAAVPVGSIVLPDDFLFVAPVPVTYWPNRVGTFAPDAARMELGRVHFAPAIPEDKPWVEFRDWVRQTLNSHTKLAPTGKSVHVAAAGGGDASGALEAAVPLAQGQGAESWPALSMAPPPLPELVYVHTNGPRFETRAEIASYVGLGHVVGMTCGKEWTLASELLMPYAVRHT